MDEPENTKETYHTTANIFETSLSNVLSGYDYFDDKQVGMYGENYGNTDDSDITGDLKQNHEFLLNNAYLVKQSFIAEYQKLSR